VASINLDELEFYGRTSAAPEILERTSPYCLGCGSSLAGRSAGVRMHGGKLIRVFACRCGRERHQEVAAR
jgi:hypothetical protein